jgi:NDP-sugar pyrophosphorylase family protein
MYENSYYKQFFESKVKEYSGEEGPLFTSGAVMDASASLKSHNDASTFLIGYGDYLFTEGDYNDIRKAHDDAKANIRYCHIMWFGELKSPWTYLV